MTTVLWNRAFYLVLMILNGCTALGIAVDHGSNSRGGTEMGAKVDEKIINSITKSTKLTETAGLLFAGEAR
jgi:hypothetical protein